MVHFHGIILEERNIPPYPGCGGELEEGDGSETPPIYCNACNLGWNSTRELHEEVEIDGTVWGP